MIYSSGYFTPTYDIINIKKLKIYDTYKIGRNQNGWSRLYVNRLAQVSGIFFLFVCPRILSTLKYSYL